MVIVVPVIVLMGVRVLLVLGPMAHLNIPVGPFRFGEAANWFIQVRVCSGRTVSNVVGLHLHSEPVDTEATGSVDRNILKKKEWLTNEPFHRPLPTQVCDLVLQ